jgi:hypothetical protein
VYIERGRKNDLNEQKKTWIKNERKKFDLVNNAENETRKTNSMKDWTPD